MRKKIQQFAMEALLVEAGDACRGKSAPVAVVAVAPGAFGAPPLRSVKPRASRPAPRAPQTNHPFK